MSTRLESCAAALRRNRFDVMIADDEHQAAELIRRRIETLAPATVCYGDSMTLQATGIPQWIASDSRFRLIDGFDPSMPREQRIELRRQGLLADLFLTGVNALTETGALLWLDMIGNRVAPIAFGPRNVILAVGRNKIVASQADAEERIRRIAAPQNIARHPDFHTPCAVTGVCSDCNSPDRICNVHMRMERCYPAGRIAVVLIDRDLGL